MNVVTRPATSVDAFLAWEERQELRYEWDGEQAHAMTGGTNVHSLIKMNLCSALVSRLRGKPCRAYDSDFRIRLANSVRYPHTSVVCTKLPPGVTWTTEPVVVFEVLSPSIQHQDIVVKNAEYEAAPSIQRYVILEQTHQGALVFSRQAGQWTGHGLSGAAAMLAMPEIGIEIPLAELYDGIEFSALETA